MVKVQIIDLQHWYNVEVTGAGAHCIPFFPRNLTLSASLTDNVKILKKGLLQRPCSGSNVDMSSEHRTKWGAGSLENVTFEHSKLKR